MSYFDIKCVICHHMTSNVNSLQANYKMKVCVLFPPLMPICDVPGKNAENFRLCRFGGYPKFRPPIINFVLLFGQRATKT